MGLGGLDAAEAPGERAADNKPESSNNPGLPKAVQIRKRHLCVLRG